MGRVFRATVRQTGEELAAKVLRPDLASDSSLVARFLQERNIMLSLDDPALVRVHDLIVEGETVAIMMDLVRGPNLREHLNRVGTMPAAEAVSVTGDVMAGLAALHARGVIHRDVKPENVLLEDAAGVLRGRLADFGIARLVDGPRMTRSTGMIGTVDYMAPELIEGHQATAAADMYSAGVMLYELLLGTAPFSGGPAAAVLHRHLVEDPVRPEGVPDDLWTQLTAMMAKDPAARPTDEEAAGSLGALAPTLSALAAFPLLELATGTGPRSSRPPAIGGDTDPGSVPGGAESGDLTIIPPSRGGAVVAAAGIDGGELGKRRRRRDLVIAAVIAAAAIIAVIALFVGLSGSPNHVDLASNHGRGTTTTTGKTNNSTGSTTTTSATGNSGGGTSTTSDGGSGGGSGGTFGGGGSSANGSGGSGGGSSSTPGGGTPVVGGTSSQSKTTTPTAKSTTVTTAKATTTTVRAVTPTTVKATTTTTAPPPPSPITDGEGSGLSATGTGGTTYGPADACSSQTAFSDGHYPPDTCAQEGGSYASPTDQFWFSGNANCGSHPYTGSQFTWGVTIPRTGVWKIQAFIPYWTNYNLGAVYNYSFAGGSSSAHVNQQAYGGKWVTLAASVTLDAGQGYQVVLTTADSYDSYCHYQPADKVEWSWVGS
jgi:serine/threonine-protein kinase